MQNKAANIRYAILLIAGVLALLAFFVSQNENYSEPKKPITSVVVGGEKFDVLIADTMALRQRGLSGRPSLKENEGMLFIFTDNAVRGFWMKEMNFPLDIIWINENQEITGIAENVLPESYPESVSSIVPVKYVLEINANTASKRGILEGKEVEFIY